MSCLLRISCGILNYFLRNIINIIIVINDKQCNGVSSFILCRALSFSQDWGSGFIGFLPGLSPRYLSERASPKASRWRALQGQTSRLRVIRSPRKTRHSAPRGPRQERLHLPPLRLERGLRAHCLPYCLPVAHARAPVQTIRPGGQSRMFLKGLICPCPGHAKRPSPKFGPWRRRTSWPA